MTEHIFRDGKTYLEYFENGVIYFDDQKTRRLIGNQSVSDFYDLVEFYLLNIGS